MSERKPFRIDAMNPKTRMLEFYAAGHLRNFRAHRVDVFVKNGCTDWLAVIGTKIYTNITPSWLRMITIHNPQYQRMIVLLEAAKLISSQEAGQELARYSAQFLEQQSESDRKSFKALAYKFGIKLSRLQLRKLAKK